MCKSVKKARKYFVNNEITTIETDTQTEETKQENQSTSLKNILGLESNSIGKYQINKYYYNGSFDFMMRGDMEKAEVQYVKGLITPATSFEIRTFDDSIKLDHDDLVVIDGMLYAIESVSVTQKRVPKKFNRLLCVMLF